ncbi:asparagine synthetase B [Streptomyces sp. ADMS]|uniref:asparagine synthetase B family protein n=1 Tax=Streptomyces sp. ADMS TaxID=3071415 RepID=UPI00296F5BC7|nr:asparagine synthetase B [Streptomyces sp. ADMS]MDW4905885.1 asparagine synthetase B [Streptomyces sp. ADMS]
MSGVVGWIDYSRNLVLQRPVITAMTGSLAHRGPDGEQVWTAPQAAFGFRALAVEPGDGRQPVVVEVDGRPVVVCVTGAPGGLAGLRDRLRAAGRRAAVDASTAELFAQAYLEWGGDFVPWMSGAFALAVWDGRSEELLLARDQLGGQTLFCTETPTGVVFGSERKALLVHPEVQPVVHANGLREVICHAVPTGPLFSGFTQVEPGEIAVFGRSGWRRRQYWKLETRPHTDDLPTTVARIRAMLDESARNSAPTDPAHAAVTLSGGVDSSTVTALIANELRRRDKGRLTAYTIDYAYDAFRSDAMRTSKDAPYARMVAEHVDALHHVVQLEAADILDPVVRLAMLRAKDCPTRIYDMDAWQQLFLQRVAADGHKVVFTGLGADNAFLGATWCNDRGLVESGTFPWVALAQRHGARSGFGTGLVNQDLLAELDLSTYYADTYADSVAGVEQLPGADDWERKMRTVAYLVLTQFRGDSSIFSATGLQVRSPINTHELLQYTYNIPAAMHRHGDIEKGLLREAISDLLPQEVVRRPRSATPISHDPGYPVRLQEEFKAMLADPQAPARPLTDLAAATELVGQPDRLAKDRMARASVELILQLNLWLDHYRVRLAL